MARAPSATTPATFNIFTRFSELLPELRIKIWYFPLPRQRLIELHCVKPERHYYHPYHFQSTVTFPVILHACSKSRPEARKRYTLTFAPHYLDNSSSIFRLFSRFSLPEYGSASIPPVPLATSSILHPSSRCISDTKHCRCAMSDVMHTIMTFLRMAICTSMRVPKSSRVSRIRETENEGLKEDMRKTVCVILGG
ncbi:hypothetical protein BDZ45DRAFT_797978 [Acephala macrosclerotiorum]|nr:hypothetical protein BDZ45DRAFT_797978 [Acephala macrosclerotiorum]